MTTQSQTAGREAYLPCFVFGLLSLPGKPWNRLEVTYSAGNGIHQRRKAGPSLQRVQPGRKKYAERSDRFCLVALPRSPWGGRPAPPPFAPLDAIVRSSTGVPWRKKDLPLSGGFSSDLHNTKPLYFGGHGCWMCDRPLRKRGRSKKVGNSPFLKMIDPRTVPRHDEDL